MPELSAWVCVKKYGNTSLLILSFTILFLKDGAYRMRRKILCINLFFVGALKVRKFLHYPYTKCTHFVIVAITLDKNAKKIILNYSVETKSAIRLR